MDAVADLLERAPLLSFALRSVHRYLAVNGTERAVVLAGQAFTALFPLVIILSTATSSTGGLRVAEGIITRMRLTGSAADAVRTLFAQPPGAVQTITLGSLLLLVVSGLSVARTLQRIYEAAWQLPPRGARGALAGLAALALFLTDILLLSLLTAFLQAVPGGSVLLFVLRAAASAALWLALQHLLLGGRVSWRRLAPGAVAAGVGQQVVAALSTLWTPAVIESNAERYGVIGVSFALLSWLVIICLVLVVAAVVSVELGDGPPLAPTTERSTGLLSTLARLLGAEGVAARGADRDQAGA